MSSAAAAPPSDMFQSSLSLSDDEPSAMAGEAMMELDDMAPAAPAPAMREEEAEARPRLEMEAKQDRMVEREAKMEAKEERSRREPEAVRRSSSSSSSVSPSGSSSVSSPDAAGGIKVQAWDPSTPYMMSIQQAKDTSSAYKAYITQRKNYRSSPAFYFDVASFFFNLKSPSDINIAVLGRKYGLSILTSVLELELEQPQLLRIVGYKLAELYLGEMAVSVFEKVQKNEI